MEIGEIAERLGGAPLLAHEHQRHLRGEQEHGLHRAHRLFGGEVGDALAEGPVADLVMVLHETDEGRGRQMSARLAAPSAVAEFRFLALVDEAG